MKWLVIFVLLGICSQAATQSAFKINVFSSTSKAVTLRWTRYESASSYMITVAPASSSSNTIAFVRFGPTTVMGTVNSLSPNTNYIFTIKALDVSDTLLSSTTTEGLTGPDLMDPIQKVTPKDCTSFMVEFKLQDGATSYIVRVEDNNGFFREDPVNFSPAEVTSLTPFTEYTLSIMSVNVGGRSQPSLPVTAKTVLPPPQLNTSSPTSDSIIVSWTPIAQAVQYTVISIHIFDSNSARTYNTSGTNLTISGLDSGALYIISCFAWDIEGRKGDSSLYTNQTTRPPTPYIYNVTVVQRNNVSALDVAWDTVMYLSEVLYDNTLFQAISNKNLTCETDSGSCNLSPVECGEVHVIEVTASNEAGPSYPSSPVNFTTFPCPPQPLAVKELEDGNCMLTWDTVPYADSYEAIIEKDDGSEETCNTTSNNCTFPCQCGYTFLISVFAFNHAGSSPQGPILNYTTLPCCPGDVSISAVSTDTLEIIWTASRGAELYQTQAVDTSEVILCNDTATVCALSDLTCDNTYRVVVIPCNEITGCNRLCTSQHTADTAPCMPENLIVNLSNSSYIGVSWAATNRAATYTVTAVGDDGKHNCTTPGNSCVLTDLHCGSKYEISAIASSAAGQSLPSYSDFVETEPCCPENLTVHQATQAMTDVSWSNAIGAHSFITSLRSPRGHASCHTQDSHCLMGCITCGTNYTVTMQAFSHTGLSSSCTYQGFSSSPCCPSGVGLYRMTGNSVRVYWRSTGRYSFVADVVGTSNSYTCSASQGTYSCDIDNIQCGDVYHVVVAPLTPEGSKVTFCSQRLYSVTCSGTSVGMVTYRGKRSVG